MVAELRDRPGRVLGRVADDDVQPAEPVDHRPHQAGHLGAVGDVGGDGRGALGRIPLQRLLEAVLASAGDRHRCAGVEEGAGHGEADAAAPRR
jgi:hypothetical protein